METEEVDSFRQTSFDILVESKLEEMEFHDALYKMWESSSMGKILKTCS